MKGGAIAVGNHVLLVSMEIDCVLREDVVAAGRCANRTPIGLYPRNAANNAVVGGIVSSVALNWGAPTLAAAADMLCPKLPARATSTTVKRMLIPTVDPVFCSVLLMPDATPLSSGGTEFMIEAVLGEANIPRPKPNPKIAMANEM